MPTRKGIGKRLRFEVFKRDSFTCQYCGKSAPDVVLHIDHIIPVVEGGGNDLVNLITSCVDCNQGKSRIKLSDDAAIKKQKKMLDGLQEKRNQLELMAEWKIGLNDILTQECEMLDDYLSRLTGYKTTEQYKNNTLKKLIKKHGIDNVISAVDAGYEGYFNEGKQEEVSKILNKLPGILYNMDLKNTNPELHQQNLVRYAMRKKYSWFSDYKAKEFIKMLREKGVGFEDIRSIFESSKTYDEFCNKSKYFLSNMKAKSNKDIEDDAIDYVLGEVVECFLYVNIKEALDIVKHLFRLYGDVVSISHALEGYRHDIAVTHELQDNSRIPWDVFYNTIMEDIHHG
jgi:DNA-binding transcriptional MerR regulator